MNLPAHHPFLSVEAKAKYLSFNEQQAKAWPVPFEERTVETPQGHTFMRVSGPADGPPLVLLPGGGTNSLMWTPNIGGLSERHRTYSLDSVLDVGRSANTRPIKTVDELTQWLDDVLGALGLRAHVRLMGLSHGAWTAAQYARRFPARLERLVLLAPAGWVLPLRPGFLLRMIQTMLPPRRYFIRRTYLSLLPDLAATGEAGLKTIDEMTEGLALAYECFGLRRMSGMLNPTPVDDAELRGLTVPTLFVIGEREQIYSSREALARLERVAPHIQRAIIEGAGHDLTWAKPSEVNRRVLDFLTSSS